MIGVCGEVLHHSNILGRAYYMDDVFKTSIIVADGSRPIFSSVIEPHAVYG